ncbi:MAG TPA: hypothetical protein VNG91_01300 [Terriglobia bacterium]|nr:hypothetical protein [Terriglobia bacterium]
MAQGAERATPRARSFWALPAGQTPSKAIEPATDSLLLQNVFQIVGVPKVKRNRRVDLSLSAESLIVRQDEKERMSVPYARIQRVEVLDGTRTYAKATSAAVVAIGVAGALLLLKKQHVDTLVIDYLNERGGQMGLILQVPLGKGTVCRDWLRRHGVAGVEPEPLLPAAPENPPREGIPPEKGEKNHDETNFPGLGRHSGCPCAGTTDPRC